MKRFFIIGAIVSSIFVLGGCGNTADNKDKITADKEISTTDNSSSKSEVETTELSGIMSEEELAKAAERDVQFECKSADGVMIRGSIRMPENYKEGDKYPVAILSHGVLGDRNQGGLFSGLAGSLEKNGIVSVRFDFDGYGDSEGSLVNNSIKTECDDLKGVIEYVKTLDYVDTDKINLVGFSMGGAATSLVAGDLKDDIHSVTLWAPASVLVDECEAGRMFDATVDVNNLPDEIPVMGGQFTFGKAFFEDAIGLDIYGTAKNYTGPVLILQGNADVVVPMSYSEKYDQTYADSELKVIDKGEHVFSGEPLEEVITLTTDFLKAKNS